MGKLTPTFKDQVQGAPGTAAPVVLLNGSGGGQGGGTRVLAAHEPLSNEPVFVPSGGPVSAFPEEFKAPAPAPVAEPAALKVALVGTAPSSRMLAPFNDPSWEIWSCSPGNMNLLPRVTKWFEIHGNLMWPEHASYGPAYIEWLKHQPFPIFMQGGPNGIGLVPNATPFPMEEMVTTFGRDFFTSSFAWMMAMAISLGAKEIALYGIDMASRDEYILQRPGFYFFKHEAERRGIKVWAPNESDIMQPPGLYGFSEVTPIGRKILARKIEIQQRLADMEGQKARLEHDITYLKGALEDVDYFHTIWGGAQA